MKGEYLGMSPLDLGKEPREFPKPTQDVLAGTPRLDLAVARTSESCLRF
jgi:hypothetical protein